MPLVLAGATSGSTTIQATDAVTATLTLPSTTGTFITTGSTGQVINKASLPTGSVIQVVQGTYATQTSTTSSTFVDTGLTATITPTSNTSKILVIVSQNGCEKGAGNTYLQLRLVKNSTTLIHLESLGNYSNTSVSMGVNASSTNYLDSPATTSATTYKTQFCSGDNSTLIYVQILNGVQPTSTITLMEIAA
jgi:hypothetical protein